MQNKFTVGHQMYHTTSCQGKVQFLAPFCHWATKCTVVQAVWEKVQFLVPLCQWPSNVPYYRLTGEKCNFWPHFATGPPNVP